MKFNKIKSSGFTLIELLIAIAIISVLSVVLVSVINPAEMMRKSRDSRRMSDLGTLKRAIDLAKADDQKPDPAGGTLDIDATVTTGNFAGFDISKYLQVVPKDPAYKASGGNMQIIAPGCSIGTTTKDAIKYQFWWGAEGTADEGKYILKANMESLSNCPVVQNDGNNNDIYELFN